MQSPPPYSLHAVHNIRNLQGWVKAQPWDRLLYILPLLIISLCSGTCIFQSGTLGKSTPSQVMRVSQDPYHVRKVSHPCQVLYYKSWTIEGNNTNHHPRLARCTSIALDQRPKIIMAKQPPTRHLSLWKWSFETTTSRSPVAARPKLNSKRSLGWCAQATCGFNIQSYHSIKKPNSLSTLH